MGGKRDPLGRNKELLAIRKRMARQLKIRHVFTDLSPELDKKLAEAAEYHDFRRIENEREIESIKAALAPCIFNDNVGVPDQNGGMRVVEQSHFEVMLKAINTFLSAMNTQNKMWGLYTMPRGMNADAPTMNIKTASIEMVQELQQIAAKKNLALPDTRNGPPATDP